MKRKLCHRFCLGAFPFDGLSEKELTVFCLEREASHENPNVFNIRKSIEERLKNYSESVPGLIRSCELPANVLGRIHGDET